MFRKIVGFGIVLSVCVHAAHLLGVWNGQSSADETADGSLHVRRGSFDHVYKMTWQPLTRGLMGAQWPFVGDAAAVGCSRDYPGRSVILIIDGEPWALNGTTKGEASDGALTVEIEGKEKVVKRWDDPPEWWAIEPGYVMAGVQGHKNLSPLFDVAEGLGCLLLKGMKPLHGIGTDQ
jgi:hypothetical protein